MCLSAAPIYPWKPGLALSLVSSVFIAFIEKSALQLTFSLSLSLSLPLSPSFSLSLSLSLSLSKKSP